MREIHWKIGFPGETEREMVASDWDEIFGGWG
jgi:hypothetical protein